jgi:hypothetical protein
MTSNDYPDRDMSNDPDVLRAEIDETRANLSQNVNALGEAVTPSNIARRQVDKVKGTAVGVKDRVMGSAHDSASSVGDSVSGLTDAATGVPSEARRKAQGNPMAAGLIALGAGWLVGSLLPSSAKEREAAQAVKDKAQPVIEEGRAVGMEAAQNLKEPAQQAAESVKSTAQDAAATVKSEGQQQAADVRSSTEESQQRIQEHQARPDTSL